MMRFFRALHGFSFARCGRALLVAACCTWLPAAAAGAQSERAAIASAHPLATAAGLQMLKQGGNAFDAAIAVAAVLAVVEPYSSGLGGGGFWLLHRAEDGLEVVVDARETAPARATPEIFVDSTGRPLRGVTVRGGKAAAIPGAPAAFVHIAAKYGRLPLARTLASAIRHARSGFPVDARYARIAKLRERFLQEDSGTARTFLDGGRAPQPGFVLRQPELATTLETLAREGRDGFYRGSVAHALVESVNAAGGVWQLSDLERYRVIEREPLRMSYRGVRVTTAPLPSAGGVALAQALNILEFFQLRDTREPGFAHLVIEALRRAFQDRALYMGDSDFVPVPLARLLGKDYAKQRAASIDPARATPAAALGEEARLPGDGGNTTHLSVIDAQGNRVAATLSINLLFGAGIIGGSSGVLLNNEMDDFSLREDVPNAFRLRGGDANSVAPGKRPLSSMAPAFVEDEKGVLILGAPGGSRIVSQVLLAILDYAAQREVDPGRIVGAPRYHHQFWPDRVEIEPEGFDEQWRAALRAKGHVLHAANRRWGNMQIVFRSKRDGTARAANDPRGADAGWN